MLSWLLIVLSAPAWLWRVLTCPVRTARSKFLGRPAMRLTVGETFWGGPHPYRDEFHVTAITMQVGVSNGSPKPNSVSAFRLEVAGFSPLFPADHHKAERGGDILIPPGGGFSSVPSRERWLDLPIHLAGHGSDWGWIGFVPLDKGGGITFGDARRASGHLVAVCAAGGEIRAPIRACELPCMDTPAESGEPAGE